MGGTGKGGGGGAEGARARGVGWGGSPKEHAAPPHCACAPLSPPRPRRDSRRGRGRGARESRYGRDGGGVASMRARARRRAGRGGGSPRAPPYKAARAPSASLSSCGTAAQRPSSLPRALVAATRAGRPLTAGAARWSAEVWRGARQLLPRRQAPGKRPCR